MSDTKDYDKSENQNENQGVDDLGAEEIVFERRADKRRRELQEQDRPILRRAIGFLILGATAYYALVTVRSAWNGRPMRLPPIALPGRAPIIGPNSGPSPTATPTIATSVIAIDENALQTIANCTVGVDALKNLDLKAHTLEAVFEPQPIAKRKITLQNLRIERPDGSEWRMHSVPEGTSGSLRTRFFRVANDGLPEDLPDDVLKASLEKASKDVSLFQEPVWSPQKVDVFKSLGSVLEEEVHEQWSYRDRVGAQTIRINSVITDLQAFMAGRFLACAQDLKTRKVLCQCRDVRTKAD